MRLPIVCGVVHYAAPQHGGGVWRGVVLEESADAVEVKHADDARRVKKDVRGLDVQVR